MLLNVIGFVCVGAAECLSRSDLGTRDPTMITLLTTWLLLLDVLSSPATADTRHQLLQIFGLLINYL